MSTADLRFEVLTPEHQRAWLAFFDGPAFADNPEWAGCYCRCFVMGAAPDPAAAEAVWDAACASGENRPAMAEGVARGEVDGVLALAGDEVVGWLHMGPVRRFCAAWGPSFPSTPEDTQPVGLEDQAAVVCFLVAAPHRGLGVGRRLLETALAELGRRGFRSVVAKAAGDPTDGAPHQFTGPLALYRSLGFEVVRPHPRRPIVWRAL